MTHAGRHSAQNKADRGHRTAADFDGAVATTRGRLARWGPQLPLRVLAVVALIVDAVIHAQLAHRYDLNVAGGLSQGNLFRIETGVAAVAAGLILLTANRIVWAVVMVITASALAAVLLSAYVHIGQVGPVPDMYEPFWYPQKVIATVAEAVGAITALAGLVGRPWRSS
jgi:hypothetical protein